jgi:hypothetical protein
MNSPPTNGKTHWWIVGMITTFLLGVAAKAFEEVQDSQGRIAVLESQIDYISKRLDSIDRGLEILIHEQKSGIEE